MPTNTVERSKFTRCKSYKVFESVVTDNHQPHHNSQMSDGVTKQSSHHGGNSSKSDRQHASSVIHGLPSEPLNLNKLMTPPDVGASSNHSRPVGRYDNSWERQFIHQQV